MMFLPPLLVVALVIQAPPPPSAQAQQPPARPASAMSVEDATILTQGWAFLAQGELARAVEKASAALAAAPRSTAALALAIEVEIARGGAAAGLDFYEQWLGARALEEPAVLRRVAFAYLRDVSVERQNPSARYSALRTLAAEGDTQALADLAEGAAQDQFSNWRALAELGSSEAVGVLIKQLQGDGAGDASTLEALGKSRQPSALAAVSAKLKDPRPEVRAAAVDAVAAIGGASAVGQLRAMLKDQGGFVAVRAAKALFDLNDPAGESLLTSLLSPEYPPATRLMGVDGMASRPTPAWVEATRSLALTGPPEVRLGAARLLAPHDPPVSEQVLGQLAGDASLAIRESAARIHAESSTNLRQLREFLRHADRATRVAAATRLLALTR
jgi:hypothetical protein